MIPVEQRQVYNADPSLRQRGDCWKCCIASILELDYDAVPHFVQLEEDGEITSFWNATQAFLREHGLVLASFTLHGSERPLLNIHDRDDIAFHFSAPGHWIASVVSPRTDGEGTHLSHAVVMNGSDVVWDPHPLRDRSGPPWLHRCVPAREDLNHHGAVSVSTARYRQQSAPARSPRTALAQPGNPQMRTTTIAS